MHESVPVVVGGPPENRLHSSIGHVPPVEYEAEHYRQMNARQQPLPGEPSLH